MKKILFITTGGTIACGTGENGLSPEKSGRELLCSLPLPCEYDVLDLYSIDSTDLSPRHMRELYRAVTKALPDFDGIVIPHGTDTMAYTGAFLSLTLGECKPVVLTGSMLSAEEKNSDAPENLLFAAQTACRADISGVWLGFCGRLINGADIRKIDSSGRDAFRPYSGHKLCESFSVPSDDAFPAVIKLSPFTEPEALDITACGAVIETYGAGGVPQRLLPAFKRLAGKIPVIVTTPCLGGTDLSRYEAGRRATDAGALMLPPMSTELAAVYLWLRYGQ